MEKHYFGKNPIKAKKLEESIGILTESDVLNIGDCIGILGEGVVRNARNIYYHVMKIPHEHVTMGDYFSSKGR